MINKKIVMFIGMVLLAAGVAYASGVVLFGGNAYEDSDDKLVLDIDLTEANYNSGTKTFADDSGEGNDGVSVNAAVFTTDKYGMSTGAMSFDGSSDYVSVSSALPSISGNITTVSVWIKLKAYDTSGFVVFGTNTGNSVYWQILRDTTVYVMSNSVTITSTDFDDDTWRHVVFVSNGTSSIVYVNGVEKGSNTNAVTSLSAGAKNFAIGDWIGGLGVNWNFNGSISQVKIYNRSLSSTEVKALYDSSKPKASAGSSQSGLVGHWALDSEGYNSNTERVTDKTPYENHGTNVGATLTTDRMGQSNQAMSFDGSSNYIDTTSVTLNDTFTVNAWVKSAVADQGSYNRIVENRYDQHFYLGTDVDGTEYKWIVSNPSSPFGSAEGGTVSQGNWQMITGTFNSTTGILYVDGVEVASDTFTVSASVNLPIYIGRYFSSSAYFWNGSISDVRIYNRVLSADEINALYSSYRPKASSGSLKKGLIFDIPLTLKYTKDEIAGSEIMTDRTPYSNDGQNNGATVGSDYTTFAPNDNIDFGSGIDFTNATFSVSIWAYPTTTSADTYIGKWQTGGNPGKNSWLLWGNIDDMYFHIEQSDNSSVNSVASNVYTINNWYHVVGVANGTYLHIYVDGVLKDSDPYDGTINPGVENIVMGIFYGNYPLSGRLASAKIYNRALSESEIKLLYDKGRW